MSQTFVFEELDSATRDYLTDVRATGGQGAPGVFALTSDSMSGCGCVSGIIVVVATLVVTLTSMVDVVYKDPGRVALLQTGGLLLGGWLIFAATRTSARGNAKVAGTWVYVDPLHVYEAFREQVTVTPTDGVTEASFTHNYNDGTYQNSVVRAIRSGAPPVVLTLKNELRAEQMVVFLNYLAWARGPEGGGRAELPPAALGALAKYVAENDHEPKDAEGNISLDLVGGRFESVPEEPKREGRAAPAFLPYVVLLVAGVALYFVMKEVVNPPIHDDAIYSAVSTEPCEPWFLQMYLLDEKNNTRHRQQVQARLAMEYDRAIHQLRAQKNPDSPLRLGMTKTLDSLKPTIRPVVSLTVSEASPKPGAEKRVEKLRDDLVGTVKGMKAGGDSPDPDYYVAEGGIMGKMAELMPPVQPREPGTTFPVPRTAVGIQLIEFASKPEDASHAHFEVTYEFVPGAKAKGLYRIKAKVEVRTDLEAAPVATYTDEPTNEFTEGQFDSELLKLKDRILFGLVGAGPTGFQLPKNFPQLNVE
ncbi:unnamed protein product [Gemmataceae bacterium]|nr:unnamed protein product [Gemmataceae bacterium]VTT99208.1 unnamed protein product [Gemmataceae bacterium]